MKFGVVDCWLVVHKRCKVHYPRTLTSASYGLPLSTYGQERNRRTTAIIALRPLPVSTVAYYTIVEFRWAGVGSSVEIRTGCGGGNFRTSVETRCLWWVVEVGCAVEGHGRFVRNVSGN